MDTTLMEYTAEDLIAHKLQRAGILISKPKFDREGDCKGGRAKGDVMLRL